MKIIKGINIKYLLVCLIILCLILGSSCLLPPVNTSPSPNSTPVEPNWTLPPSQGQSQFLPNIADVVAKVKPSVVAINTEVITYDIFRNPYKQTGAGSGWIIDENGRIVTNNHVVEGAKSVTVTLADGRTFPASVVGADAYSDLAVVKIDARNLNAASVGNSSQLRVGDWVVAIGNPLGLGISAKEGIISRLGVSLEVSSGQTLYDLIETSAAINPGNSGGPLVNMAGEVIGITSAKIATVGVEGMGYAISINTAMPIIKELIQKGYVVRPWLDEGFVTVNPYIAFKYSLAVDKGAFVTTITPGSPADKAGIKPGDIITSFDDKEITTADELNQDIYSSQIEQKVKITYWRGNNKNTTYATLTESPPPEVSLLTPSKIS
jgi:serine protease Do